MNLRVMLALATLLPAGLIACGGGSGSSSSDDGAGGGDTETTAVGAGGENPGGGEGPECGESEIPELALWEERMVGWEAQMHCDALAEAPGAGDPGLNAFLTKVDYDAIRVYDQIADYTGDEKWRTCAQRAEKVYRDAFVLPEDGGVVAYWNHTTGLTMDALAGDQKSKDAVLLLAENGDYCSDDSEESTEDPLYSRENANCLLAMINAERLGAPRREKMYEFYENAYGHIDQWFVSRSYGYYEPFMFALTAEALINYYEYIDGDQEVVDAVVMGLDVIWDEAWVPELGAFRYSTDEDADENGKDLNLIIAPVFAWAYERTCEPRFKERGDEVFAYGVKNAFLGNETTGEGAKQFNQNYRWSFDYVRLRQGG
jgi:hypothetical protein